MALDETQNRFIGNLLNLAKQADRGALADLRSGLGKKIGKMGRVHKYVAPYPPEKPYDERWYYLVATLFGLFPEHREECKFGTAFGQLKRKSDSMEARFIALLNAHPDDLGDHLRHAVSLLKSNEKPFNWFLLFKDLLLWTHPEGYTQLNWARDFYGVDSQNNNDTPDSDLATEAEGEERP